MQNFLTYSDFKDTRVALINWFKNSSGLDRVLWANQMAKGQCGPRATLNIIAMPETPGIPEKRSTTINYVNTVETTEQSEVTLSINVYTETQDLDNDALIILDKVSRAVRSLKVQVELRLSNIAFIEKSSIRNIDEQLGDRWEKRVQQDYTFRYVSTVSEEVGTITKVGIDGETKVSDTETVDSEFIVES